MKLRNSLISAACAVFLTSSSINAALVDAISVVVDNEPITIYEIYALSKQFDIQAKEALDVLIRQKLELAQIKTLNIQVSDYDVNRQISEIAEKNNLSVQTFYNVLKNDGIASDVYKSELRQKMQREKLYQYVLSSKFQAANEDDFLFYYNKNRKEFTRFENFDVVKFESQNAQDLEDISVKQKDETDEDMTTYAPENSLIDETDDVQENLQAANDEQDNTSIEPLGTDDEQSILSSQANAAEQILLRDKFEILSEDITVASENIASLDSDPKIVSMLSQTDVNTLTPTIQTKDGFARFFVEAKNNESVLPYEQVKNFIMAKISSKQENEILKEYFDMLKSRATITIIRLP
ncbi:MAG: SurA N-terminal domain-containing protein [Campylobacteraceae bacterium]|nr:SurA N-terminal domain-containing protein [Campylobacteraceae bacterium]